MVIETIDHGLALHSLGQLSAEEIPQLALLFLSAGCDALEMAALAYPPPDQHPADLRRELEHAVALAGRSIPDRLLAAQTLRRILARKGSLGELAPREAARAIIDVFNLVDAELPDTGRYVGESFGVSTVIGLYYSYDDVEFDEAELVAQIDLDLTKELKRLAEAASS